MFQTTNQSCQPWINKPQTAVYHKKVLDDMTIGGVPPRG